jgi:hypothetical protein
VDTENPETGNLEAPRVINQLRFSVGLLQRNYVELVVAIRHISSPPVAFEMVGRDDQWHRKEAMAEVLYLLHNYVASAKSLIDHTRRVHRKLSGSAELISAYQSEVNLRFVDDPLSQFIENLREMAQHYRLPRISLTRSFSSGPSGATMTTRLQLKTDDLREYKEWSAPARKYLDAGGNTIDVLDLVERYHVHVAAFHTWFSQQQIRIYGVTPILLDQANRFGVHFQPEETMDEVARRVDALSAKPRAQITYEELHNALMPALTIWDSQRLRLCEHDIRHWVPYALEVIDRRFTIPKTTRDALLKLASESEPSSA